MNLLIISHTPHYFHKNGTVTGWGPTIIENNYIANLFHSVTILGFLHKGPSPKSALPYSSQNIKFKPLAPSGGVSFLAKLKAIFSSLHYLIIIINQLKHMEKEDWVYVRCPCNIGFIACLLFSITKRRNTWFKYAGNWRPTIKEPLSYSIQRFILEKNFCRGKVTINGEWPNQPRHLKSFLNPCLIEASIRNTKNQDFRADLTPPIGLLYVGRVETQKGLPVLIKIMEKLREKNIQFHLKIIGDGPEKSKFEKSCEMLGLINQVDFMGEIPHNAIPEHYQKAHFFLFPSSASEGWPKVISEAMAYGCVPIASNISSIPLTLSKYQCGYSLPINPKMWVEKILTLTNTKHEWSKLSEKGRRSSQDFTYEAYLQKLESQILTNGD